MSSGESRSIGKEFQPALRFVFTFVGLYLIGNLLYGWYVTSYHLDPDPVTKGVAFQTATALRGVGYPVHAVVNLQGPKVFLRNEVRTVINIYEGCNGINVMIVFVSFLVAFGGSLRKLSWFLPVGILIIHIANIIRLMILYWFAIDFQRYFYYFHKYIFTAILYLIIIILWYFWITKINAKRATSSAT